LPVDHLALKGFAIERDPLSGEYVEILKGDGERVASLNLAERF